MIRYLGLDCSTQSLTAVVIDLDEQKIVCTAEVNYGRDLPDYKCPQGLIITDDPLVRRSNPLMWLDALELLFDKLKASGLDLSTIQGIGGSAQQHGTVYLSDEFKQSGWLKQEGHLRDFVKPLLTRAEAPSWMDSSTFDECRAITQAFAKRDYVHKCTGSAATERFAGPQIKWFAEHEPENYARTGVIHLVSSFICSVLIGTSAPLDYGDASGMNLMNLKTNEWEPSLLRVTAPDLNAKLPRLALSTHVAGVLHPFYRRYGFGSNVRVLVWSGDNLNSLIGVGAYKSGTAVLSLGTSDTFFSAMDKIAIDPEGYGHVFVNPAGGFMSLICFKNGSFAREIIRDEFGLSWKEFDNDAFRMTVAGNAGCMMLPYFTAEITPLVLNACPFYKGNALFESRKDASAIVRALVEAQAMTMRLHSQWISTRPKKLIVTGGASKSQGMCQVFADVFNATVVRQSMQDSAGLGAAIRAAQGIGGLDWSKLTKTFCKLDSDMTVKPIDRNVAIYDEQLPRYAAFEKDITG